MIQLTKNMTVGEHLTMYQEGDSNWFSQKWALGLMWKMSHWFLGFPPKFQTIIHWDTLGVIVILFYMAAVDWAVKSSSLVVRPKFERYSNYISLYSLFGF